MIEITESAARVITRQLEKRRQPQGGLRLAVKAGGCSGFSYQFAWNAEARETDRVFEVAGGARVFVDPRSLALLDGTVLDFDEHNLMATSFTLKNPHATSTCGCGESFSAQPPALKPSSPPAFAKAAAGTQDLKTSGPQDSE